MDRNLAKDDGTGENKMRATGTWGEKIHAFGCWPSSPSKMHVVIHYLLRVTNLVTSVSTTVAETSKR